MRLDVVKIDTAADFDAAFVRARKAQVDGLIVLGSPFFSAHRAR